MWWTPLVGPLTNIVDKIIDRIPNKNDREKAKEEFQLQLLHTLDSATKGQIEINKMEAAHKSIFVAGWRPFIGWVCGIAIAWSFLIYPIASWIMMNLGNSDVPLPVLDSGPLYQLVLAMLGMGGLRTFEKIKGVARER